MSLNRQQLLQPVALQKKRVDLPEFGDGQYVWIHQLTALQTIEIERAMLLDDASGLDVTRTIEFKQRQVIAAMRDDAGELLLSIDDLPIVNGWPSSVFERLHDAVVAMQGKGKVTGKNSGPTPG